MRKIRGAVVISTLAIVCMVLMINVSAAVGIQAALGETITLSGYSYGSDTVYLFLTGPNLPANGVALNDITKRADQGGFTRVSVGDQDRWVYKWNTNSIGGRLDEGTYTVWVVNGPNDRSRLNQAEYSTISVSLGRPGISLTTPSQPGIISLRSVPDEVSVTLDGDYQGKTPLNLRDLTPGIYNITFSRFGYTKFSTPVRVEAGKTTEVTATLILETGSLAVNTSPAGARLIIDGTDAGTSPVTLTNLVPGNHTLNVSKEGYRAKEQPVRVVANEIVPVDVALSPAGLRSGNVIWATMVTCCVALFLAAFRRSCSRD